MVFCHFDTSLISQYIMTHKMFLTGRLANTHTVCVWVGLCLGLRGVTSKCRDPRELVPRGVPEVWSLHISHIPRYAGLITLASSAAPWLPLCTDSCWPPSTNILLLLPQSTYPFFCLRFHPIFTVCVCVCGCHSCGPDPGFHLDQTQSATEVEVASACF